MSVICLTRSITQNTLTSTTKMTKQRSFSIYYFKYILKDNKLIKH